MQWGHQSHHGDFEQTLPLFNSSCARRKLILSSCRRGVNPPFPVAALMTNFLLANGIANKQWGNCLCTSFFRKSWKSYKLFYTMARPKARDCHVKSGPGQNPFAWTSFGSQKWSGGKLWQPKLVPPGPILAAKSGPTLNSIYNCSSPPISHIIDGRCYILPWLDPALQAHCEKCI